MLWQPDSGRYSLNHTQGVVECERLGKTIATYQDLVTMHGRGISVHLQLGQHWKLLRQSGIDTWVRERRFVQM